MSTTTSGCRRLFATCAKLSAARSISVSGGFGPSALSNRNATSGERKIENTNQPKPSRWYRLLAFTPTMIERIIQKMKSSSTTSPLVRTPWVSGRLGRGFAYGFELNTERMFSLAPCAWSFSPAAEPLAAHWNCEPLHFRFRM
jgi:hypothetical protein